MTEDIPQDCDMAILFQPESDLTEAAANRVSDYLSNGGNYGKNLFYVPTHTVLESPNLDSILEEWGMSIGQGIVADTDSSHMPYIGDYYCSVFEYGSSEYADGLKDTKKYLIGAYTRPVIIDDSAKATAIATTSESSAMRSFDADENWNPSEHIEGSFNAGAVSTKSGDGTKSTLTVWGTGMSFYSQWLNSSTFNNGEYFANLFNKLTNREDSEITIASKNTQSEQLGIMSAEEALRIATEQDLDLVKIAPGSNPPVCKIMDYGKFRFEQTKKEKDAKKNQRVIEIKEIRMSPGIDTNDFNTKLRNGQKFLSDGDRVKVSVRFRGREMAHTEIGEVLLRDYADKCAEIAVLDKAPKLEGRNMSIFLSPKPVTPPKKPAKPKAPKPAPAAEE